MSGELPFPRIALLGTGLIGGSFGLAVRNSFPQASIVGWDRPEALERAATRGAVTETATDLALAVAGADLVYVALPVGAILDNLPAISRAAAPSAIVTDAGSTKAAICRAAAREFTRGARFIGGHPIAGRESSGIESADAELFRGAHYVLVGEEDSRSTRLEQFLKTALGVETRWMDAETHDWATAIVSHLPQMLAVALASVVLDETDETDGSGLPLSLAGPALRDVARLAGSPYSMWRDICLTNGDNIGRALDRITQAIDHLRRNLGSRELEKEFAAANSVYNSLHKRD
ncbi:MAG: prephenate dehydrogenase/arogenate dehydrogenase family protein [Acidipila sp.]|nr:prephenate dehydrogenase/arogenate dehydrogenase family protein [Acidipila sp.]